MNHLKQTLLSLAILALAFAGKSQNTPDTNIPLGIQREWFRDAKFGLFIHWGLYAIPAQGEWYMNTSKVPRDEYRQYAGQFNPVGFNPDSFALCAKNAGMKYMVITSKHHDGFAMFDSKVSEYNIVDGAPYGKDVLKGLSEACSRHGVKLGFYYSQAQDWDEPDAYGGYFQMKPAGERNFDKYFYEKCVPQVSEILTNYGKIWEMWFDTPGNMGSKFSTILFDMVRSYQPECMINSRISSTATDQWDFVSCFDNTIPSIAIDNGFEVCATLTHGGWGYNKDHQVPSSRETVVGMLCDIAGLGGNYLLNVGPSEMGVIPKAQVERLKEVGDWLQVYGDAIYGTHANPFKRIYDWGTMTWKDNKLFLIFYKEPGKSFELSGLKNQVKSASWMHNKKAIKVDYLKDRPGISLQTTGSKGYDIFPVAVLELEGQPVVEDINYQQGSGEVQLELVHAKDARLGIPVGTRYCQRATVWTPMREPGEELEWTFHINKPGKYTLEMVEFAGREIIYNEGESLDPHAIEIKVNDQSFTMKPEKGKIVRHRFNDHGIDLVSTGGILRFTKPGTYTLHAKVIKIGKRNVRTRDLTETGKMVFNEEPRLLLNGFRLLPQ